MERHISEKRQKRPFWQERAEIKRTLVAIAITPEIVIEKQQQIAGIAETVPSCTYCVATIVASQLLTTVRGGNQPSGLQGNQA